MGNLMSNKKVILLNIEAVRTQLMRASQACGASETVASAISEASLDAEIEGSIVTGLSHFVLYCEAMLAGRVDGRATPIVSKPTPVLFSVDARQGFLHIGFDSELDAFCTSATQFGVGIFSASNGFTCGNLGYFARRVAERNLVALAATNAGPAMLAASGSTKPVFATNPIAFAAPRDNGAPLLIDQASSQATWVSILQAAEKGESIPAGQAIDADGNPTIDPSKALKGALVAAGGQRGANIALMVEMLAAGLTGSNWSLDAPSFAEGDQNPGVGLLVIAINPKLLGGDDYTKRLAEYLDRLDTEYGVYVPGTSRAKKYAQSLNEGIEVDKWVWETIIRFADSGKSSMHR
jgi:(2R)-3-sulfolactate dehydrogenase (NADP+)